MFKCIVTSCLVLLKHFYKFNSQFPLCEINVTKVHRKCLNLNVYKLAEERGKLTFSFSLALQANGKLISSLITSTSQLIKQGM